MAENTETYITFSVSIKKEVENGKKSKYKLNFIDSLRFMSSLLSSLVDNLSEGLLNYKWTDCKSCLDYMLTKDNKLKESCRYNTKQE